MERNEPAGWKKVVFPLILLTFFVFVSEGLLSMYFYNKNGPEKLASIETLRTIKNNIVARKFDLNTKNHELVRPDSSAETNRKVAEETVAANKFVHQSWVEYRNENFQGNYINVKDAIRKSIPELSHPSSKDGVINIYFFGGSTMFGFNVLDHETIPSRFVAMYKERYPNGRPIRVVNYGTPTYYSYQELTLFSHLIFEGHKPDLVVFLDGLNDFWFATASYYRQSYFSYIFRQVFNRGLRSRGEFKFIDTAEAMFRDPAYIPKEKFNHVIMENYFKNMENIHLMSNLIGSKAYFFCQPSPFYKYPNQQTDPMCFKDTNTRFDYIYPEIEKRASDLHNFTFLGNMLERESGYPFVDGLHYSPSFIDKITGRILDRIAGEINSDSLVLRTENNAAMRASIER